MDLCVLRIRQQLYILVAACLMVGNVMSETRHDRSVEALGLAAGWGVIFSHGQLLNAKTDNDCCEELEHELQSVVGQQIGRGPIQDDSIIYNKRSL